ncbi:MAG: hypothetical protein RLZZ69_2964, partial [Cyanobacteriota bacterium]
SSALVTGSAIGGTLPYQLAWSNGQSGESASLLSGDNSLDVMDANGCSAQSAFFIDSYLGVSITTDLIVAPSCNGLANGSISVAAITGAGVAGYAWTPNVSEGAEANDLLAGLYTIEVSDNDGCTSEITVELTEPDELEANKVTN